MPLIVSDPQGRLGAVPNTVRHQLTSSVDFAPLLLTLADGSERLALRPALRASRRRARTSRGSSATRAAPGRHYALHATDEVLTEFALLPYAAERAAARQGHHHAEREVRDLHALAAPARSTLLPRGEQSELYDYTHARRLPRDRQPGRAQPARGAAARDAGRGDARGAAAAAAVEPRRGPGARARRVPPAGRARAGRSELTASTPSSGSCAASSAIYPELGRAVRRARRLAHRPIPIRRSGRSPARLRACGRRRRAPRPRRRAGRSGRGSSSRSRSRAAS